MPARDQSRHQYELRGSQIIFQQDEQNDESIDLREYLAVLRRRKWSIILLTLLALSAALSYSYWQTPIYSASARVLVQPVGTGVGASAVAAAVDVATEGELLASEPVAEMVREELGLETSTPQLLEGLEVTEVTETKVLKVTHSSTDPEVARDAANSFAQNYITYGRQQALIDLRAVQDSVQEEIQGLTDELANVERAIAEARKANSDTVVGSLEGKRILLLAQLGVLQQQANDASSSGLLGGGKVIQSATLPSSPSSPNHIKNGIFGLFLGLVLGIGVAFLRERLDDRFKGSSDVEQQLGVPVIASIPFFGGKGRKGKDAHEVVALTKPNGAAAESYRSLRTNLQFVALQRQVKSLLITSASAKDGKTATTVNLAVALAEADKRVIVVSADMRRPMLERYFNIKQREGLSTWLTEDHRDIGQFIVDPGIANLRVIPCGPLPTNPAELLTSIRVTRLVETLEAHCDFLLLDTPPVLAVADAGVICSRVGGAVLVLDARTSHRSTAHRAKQELERAGGTLLGSVLNAFDTASSSYYYGSPYYSPPGVSNGKAGGTDKEEDRRERRFSFRR